MKYKQYGKCWRYNRRRMDPIPALSKSRVRESITITGVQNNNKMITLVGVVR